MYRIYGLANGVNVVAAKEKGLRADIGNILRESLDHELASLNCYKDLLKLVEGDSIMLEEYARTMIHTEEMHLGEVDKMLRNPGDVEPFNK